MLHTNTVDSIITFELHIVLHRSRCRFFSFMCNFPNSVKDMFVRAPKIQESVSCPARATQ